MLYASTSESRIGGPRVWIATRSRLDRDSIAIRSRLDRYSISSLEPFVDSQARRRSEPRVPAGDTMLPRLEARVRNAPSNRSAIRATPRYPSRDICCGFTSDCSRLSDIFRIRRLPEGYQQKAKLFVSESAALSSCCKFMSRLCH